MVTRDPETGQFRAGDGDSDIAQTYDDLDKMQVQQTARVNDAGSTGGSVEHRALPEIDLQRTDTLSLDNDEMAELVLLEVHALRAYVDDNDFGTQGNFRCSMSIALNFDNAQWLGDNDLESENLGTSMEIAGRTRLESDERILWRGHTTYQNGDGELDQGDPISYPSSHNHEIVPFRAWFGQGPLVDSNDSIVHGASYNIVNMGGNANIVQILDWTGYFDVFRIEGRIRR